MILPAIRRPGQSILLLAGLLVTAALVGLAQTSAKAPPSLDDRHPAWESIESPENTDFWSTLLSDDQAVAGESAPEWTTHTNPASARRLFEEYFVKASLPAGEITKERPAEPGDHLIVNEDGSFEYNTDAVQGNAGGREEPLDEEACGGR